MNMTFRHKSGASALMAAFVALLVLAACGSDSFRIKGNIADGGNQSVVLERSDATGHWITLDSTRTSVSGDFSFKYEAADAPDIYRLVCDGRYIYVPVDSTETITVTANFKDFGYNHTLEGSEQAKTMAEFDKRLATLGDNPDEATLKQFKRETFGKFIQPGRGSIVSYYVLTKHIGGRPLFDPEDATDAKYYAAVATAYELYKPTDPRTKMLKEISLAGLRKAASQSGKKRVVEAQEIAYFDIDLPDVEGNDRRLSEFVGKGKPVMLVFSVMSDENAPAFNRAIKRVHDSGKATVYQVGFDADRYAWRSAASNLPWINVYETAGSNSQSILNYNLTTLPACFLIDASGNLVKRGDNPAQLGL